MFPSDSHLLPFYNTVLKAAKVAHQDQRPAVVAAATQFGTISQGAVKAPDQVHLSSATTSPNLVAQYRDFVLHGTHSA